MLLSRSPLKLKGRGRRWILSSHRSKAVAAKCCVIKPRLEPVPYWLNCFPEVFSAPFELRRNKPRRLRQIR